MRRLSWVLFFAVVIYFIFLIRQDIIDNLELKKENRVVLNNLSKEERTKAELKNRLERLRSDDLIEELARTRLGLIKKGEVAYKVVR